MRRCSATLSEVQVKTTLCYNETPPNHEEKQAVGSSIMLSERCQAQRLNTASSYDTMKWAVQPEINGCEEPVIAARIGVRSWVGDAAMVGIQTLLVWGLGCQLLGVWQWLEHESLHFKRCLSSSAEWVVESGPVAGSGSWGHAAEGVCGPHLLAQACSFFLCFLAAMRWRLSLHTLPPRCFYLATSLGALKTKRGWNLSPWVKVNLSSVKLFVSGILLQ